MHISPIYLTINLIVTNPNVTVYVIGFMPPEVIAGKGSSPASDMFAWAATLVQLCLRAHQAFDPRSLDAALSKFPEEGRASIELMLWKLMNSDPVYRVEASKVIQVVTIFYISIIDTMYLL